MRVAFFGLLIGTLSVLYVDYRELTEGEGLALAMPQQPILPAFAPGGPDTTPHPQVTSSPEALDQNLVIALQPAGVLSLTGTFDSARPTASPPRSRHAVNMSPPVPSILPAARSRTP